MDDKRSRRLRNILYKLRKKGIRAERRIKTIFVPITNKEMVGKVPQIKHLRDGFHYDIQFIIE